MFQFETGHQSAMPKLPTYSYHTSRTGDLTLKPVTLNVRHGNTGLRTIKISDASQTMADWLMNPAVVAGLNSSGKPVTLPELRTYIAGFDQIRRNLALIYNTADSRSLGLMMFDIEPRHRIASFHLVVSSFAGVRIDDGYHAIRLLLKHLFTERGVEKVCIEPLSRNQSVVRSCEWFGFTLEGVLRSHRSDTLTGARLDQHLFGLTKAEYLNWPHR